MFPIWRLEENGAELRECRKPFSRWRQVISRFVQHCYQVANYLELKQKTGFLLFELFGVLSKNSRARSHRKPKLN